MKILLPVDGSAAAERAVAETIKWLKRNPSLEVTILHVSRTGDRTHLDQAQEKFTDAGFSVETKLVRSKKDVAGEIAALVKEGSYGHLVMGRRGSGDIKTLLLGSVSRKVLYLVDTPVMLVA